MQVLIFNKAGAIVPAALRASSFEGSNPRDINIGGHSGDPRTLDKLIDGVNSTGNDRHMWLIPYTKGGIHLLQIDLGSRERIVGLRVWNYNKSLADTYRGARFATIDLDGRSLFPHIEASSNAHTSSERMGFFEFRKAPGSDAFDFGQDIYFRATQPEPATLGLGNGAGLSPRPKSLACDQSRLSGAGAPCWLHFQVFSPVELGRPILSWT